MNDCATCGLPRHVYGAAFLALWAEAMRWFPLYSLPEPACEDCRLVRAGLRVPGYRARRRAWLRSTTPIAVVNPKDPATAERMRRGARQAKAYRKLIATQKAKMRKLRTKRYMRMWDRKLKARAKEIRKVLERAAEE